MHAEHDERHVRQGADRVKAAAAVPPFGGRRPSSAAAGGDGAVADGPEGAGIEVGCFDLAVLLFLLLP